MSIKSSIRTPTTIANRQPAGMNRHVGVCDVTGKKRYSTREAAKTVKRMTGSKCAVYFCACGHYELGSRLGMSRDEHRQLSARKAAAKRGEDVSGFRLNGAVVDEAAEVMAYLEQLDQYIDSIPPTSEETHV